MKNFALLFTLALASTNLLAMEQEGLKRKAENQVERPEGKKERREYSIRDVPHAVIAIHTILPIIYGTEDINEVFKTLRSAARTGELSKAITHPAVKEHLKKRVERDLQNYADAKAELSQLEGDASGLDHAIELGDVKFLKKYFPIIRNLSMAELSEKIENRVKSILFNVHYWNYIEDQKVSLVLSALIKDGIDINAIINSAQGVDLAGLSAFICDAPLSAAVVVNKLTSKTFHALYKTLNNSILFNLTAARLIRRLNCVRAMVLAYELPELRSFIGKGHTCTQQCGF